MGCHGLQLLPPTAPVAEITEISHPPGYRVLVSELRKLGYVEGRNLDRREVLGRGTT
jgi:hypothetical protein